MLNPAVKGSRVIAAQLRNATAGQPDGREVNTPKDRRLQCKAMIESTLESIITVDEQGNVIDMNTASTGILRASGASLTDLNIDEVIIGFSDDSRSHATSFGRGIRSALNMEQTGRFRSPTNFRPDLACRPPTCTGKP